MVVIALFLAVSVAVAVWLWARTAVRRGNSHADLPKGFGAPEAPIVQAGDSFIEDHHGTTPKPEKSLKSDASRDPKSPNAPGSSIQVDVKAEAPTAQTLIRAGAQWMAGAIEIEPGIGVVCAKGNHYKDPAFEDAQNHLKNVLNLFLITKNDRDAVLSKECGLLLTSRLADLEHNSKIQDAYALGVPVLLAEDVGACRIGDSVKVYLSPAQLQHYKRGRSEFDANWELVSYQLKGNDMYFLTHSYSGYKLLAELEDHLEQALGPKQEIKGQYVPKGRALDFVVVPTLRTTSARFISVLARENPVLAIRSYDLEGRSVGDMVPAWRWKGGEYFIYPPMKRERTSQVDLPPEG